MIDKIKKVVNQNPQKIAYMVNDESITYKELYSSAYNYAQLLKRQGTSPVIIYGHKNISVVISILACIIANRTYVPIGTCTPIYRVKQIINITKSQLILTEEKITLENVDCRNLNELEQYANYDIKENINDIVYIIFTSGSTGIPKGVPISKKNLYNFTNWISNLEPLCNYKDINVLNQASFSFDLSVADFYYSLLNGHTLIAFDGDINENYNKIFNIMTKIDVAVMTPTFMKLCLLNEDFNTQKYPHLKCVYFCGEQLEIKLAKKIYSLFPNIKIINAYGPTEATERLFKSSNRIIIDSS